MKITDVTVQLVQSDDGRKWTHVRVFTDEGITGHRRGDVQPQGVRRRGDGPGAARTASSDAIRSRPSRSTWTCTPMAEPAIAPAA